MSFVLAKVESEIWHILAAAKSWTQQLQRMRRIYLHTLTDTHRGQSALAYAMLCIYQANLCATMAAYVCLCECVYCGAAEESWFRGSVHSVNMQINKYEQRHGHINAYSTRICMCV